MRRPGIGRFDSGQASGNDWGDRGRTVDLRLAIEQISPDQATLASGTRMHYRMRDPDTVEFVWHAGPGRWLAGVLARNNPAAQMSKVRIPLDPPDGGQDPFYKLSHSRGNFARFTEAGGHGEFHVLPAAIGRNGHSIADDESLWREPLAGFVDRVSR